MTWPQIVAAALAYLAVTAAVGSLIGRRLKRNTPPEDNRR